MVRRKITGALYNEEVKNKYLNNYHRNSINSFRRVFLRTSIFEHNYNKDLCYFSLEEIMNALDSFKPSNLNMSKFYGNTIRSYIDWSICIGNSLNKQNPLNGREGVWYKHFVDDSKKTYFHKDEIDNLISLCVNDQDKAIILALFESIKPEEIIRLRPEDINSENNVLNLQDGNGNKRRIVVSKNCVDVLIAASRQKLYLKNNGVTSPTLRSSIETELVDTGTVIKISNTNNNVDGNPDEQIIYRRLRSLKSFLPNELQYIRPKSLRNSGMLYQAYLIYKDKKIIDSNDLNNICKLYDIKRTKNRNNGFNKYTLTADFFNEETILDVYGYQQLLDHEEVLNKYLIIEQDDDQLNDYQIAVMYAKATNTSEEPLDRFPQTKHGESLVWSRNPGRAREALNIANFLCEYDNLHTTFISPITNKNYVEAHHLIPFKVQNKYMFSLDVPANIVALCPNCHRAIHHATFEVKKQILNTLHNKRRKKLELSLGRYISLQELESHYD